MNDSEPDEDELKKRLTDDPQKNFWLLVGKYEARLCALARLLTGNPQDAEDVVQIAWMKVYSHICRHPAKDIENLKNWLRKVLHSAHRDFLNRPRRPPQPPIPMDDPIMELLPDNPVSRPPEKTEAEEIREIIDDAIAELPEPYRTVARLRYIEGLREPEILPYFPNIPKNTVHTWITRTRNSLRKILKRRMKEKGLDL